MASSPPWRANELFRRLSPMRMRVIPHFHVNRPCACTSPLNGGKIEDNLEVQDKKVSEIH